MALFVSSFLVLFLETALIRWMPAYVRLLAYFSNFILLASFLGIGVGCLLARRRNLIVWFPLIQFSVILAVDLLRLEVALPSTSTIYFSSGTAESVVPVESTLLLPLLFTSVAALFVTVAHRMGRELTGTLPPLRAYAINLLGSLTGVAAFALVSWLQLPPSVWFGVAALAALPFVAQDRRWVAAANVALLAGSLAIVHRMEGGSLWSP